MATTEVKIPDLGGASDVDVIELLVKPGDKVTKEQSLITLEGDKATMEIPAPFDGTVKTMKVKLGEKVSEGDVIMTMDVAEKAQTQSAESTETEVKEKAPEKKEKTKIDEKATKKQTQKETEPSQTSKKEQTIKIPDIGGATDVDVIEIMVKNGDKIAAEQSLITLEGDKATMEIPAPSSGVVKAIKLKVGDKVSQGDNILILEAAEVQAETEAEEKEASAGKEKPKAEKAEAVAVEVPPETTPKAGEALYASPIVRRIAREFGLDLNLITGTGHKGRISKEDVQAFVKGQLAKAQGMPGIGGAAMPAIDFSQFGEIETTPLNKIKRLTGTAVHQSWITVPHVTQFGEADITELENFRKTQKATAEKQGLKLTPLVFIMKAVVAGLKALPQFNSSLSPNGQEVILKKYFHIGVAVDTPNGLVVPVIRDVDQKGLLDLAKELAQISTKAREKGLTVKEMAGSSFTISSLGGIGGTSFTPIVKTPDVAILGVSRAAMKPIYQDGSFVPRLMLPLSLSYDHRVIDGADGARFMVTLSNYLSDVRTLLL